MSISEQPTFLSASGGYLWDIGAIVLGDTRRQDTIHDTGGSCQHVSSVEFTITAESRRRGTCLVAFLAS